ncbi:NUDIX hydrolase, partial [Candidatus Saccharibacteria bacterium]|nr:NUDIX hydrolase [Candidatus Saccharibacteria bacterium]
MFKGPYIPPTVTVDCVVFQIIDRQLYVALVQRSQQPFDGKWALPGGYNPAGETTLQAVTRIVKTKTGIDIKHHAKYIEQLYTFDSVARDPRGHAVAISYMACGLDIIPHGGTEPIQFFAIDSLPELAFDHHQIIQYAHSRLSAKLSYTNVVYSLLPEKFTLTNLQTAYEAVFERPLDKRNFRKKFMQLDMIE